jgi:hypothetical protein
VFGSRGRDDALVCAAPPSSRDHIVSRLEAAPTKDLLKQAEKIQSDFASIRASIETKSLSLGALQFILPT